MDLTELGIVREVREVQLPKTFLPMVWTESGMARVVRDLQFVNA